MSYGGGEFNPEEGGSGADGSTDPGAGGSSGGGVDPGGGASGSGGGMGGQGGGGAADPGEGGAEEAGGGTGDVGFHYELQKRLPGDAWETYVFGTSSNVDFIALQNQGVADSIADRTMDFRLVSFNDNTGALMRVEWYKAHHVAASTTGPIAIVFIVAIILAVVVLGALPLLKSAGEKANG